MIFNKFEKFKIFHEENPNIYVELVELAEKVIKVKDAYSVYALFHVIRFNRDIKTNGEEFKISNDFIPFYARLLIIEFPKFKDFFEIKDGKNVRYLEKGDFEEIINKHENYLF